MPFREAFEHMLAVNASVEGMVADTVMTAHTGDVAMEEDNIFHKLILISLNLSVEDVSKEDAVHRMALALEEERTDSYSGPLPPYAGYLNNNHNMILK